MKNPWFAFFMWKKYNRICQYHQLSGKKTQTYEQSAELSNFVKSKEASVIVKGLRTVLDFEYEFQMALLNKALNPEYETVFLMTDTKYSYISSSMVKELAGFNGDLTGLVPHEIVEKIKEKYK